MSGTCFDQWTYAENTWCCSSSFRRQFGTKCAKCSRHIQSTDWVRHARNAVYHLACFSCDVCKRQLSTGEEFALQEDKVMCKPHYLDIIEGGTSSGRCIWWLQFAALFFYYPNHPRYECVRGVHCMSRPFLLLLLLFRVHAWRKLLLQQCLKYHSQSMA